MQNPHEGRPPHPRYGAPLGGRPVTIAGVVFRPYRAGIMDTVRCSDDFRITIRTNHDGGGQRWTYSAVVDGVAIRGASGNPRRFRSDYTAAEAAVKLLKQRADTP